MIKRFKTYIENEPWEDNIPAWESLGNAVAYVLMAFAVLYWAVGVHTAVLP